MSKKIYFDVRYKTPEYRTIKHNRRINTTNIVRRFVELDSSELDREYMDRFDEITKRVRIESNKEQRFYERVYTEKFSLENPTFTDIKISWIPAYKADAFRETIKNDENSFDKNKAGTIDITGDLASNIVFSIKELFSESPKTMATILICLFITSIIVFAIATSDPSVSTNKELTKAEALAACKRQLTSNNAGGNYSGNDTIAVLQINADLESCMRGYGFAPSN